MDVSDLHFLEEKSHTMLPASVDPRAQANKMSLHPPRENSFDVVPVLPRPNWRFSIGPAAARPARIVTRNESWKCILYEIIRVSMKCVLVSTELSE